MKEKKSAYYRRVWSETFADKRFRTTFIITFLLFTLILLLFTRFLLYVEARQGVIFSDPFLQYHQAVDLSTLIFAMIYFALITAVIYLTRHPQQLVFAMQTYGIMVIIRTILMYSLPLDPPADMIPLADPFVALFGDGQILTRDLFFSGHTATMVVLYLTAIEKKIKAVFMAAAIIIAAGVLIQKVHYTIDVLAAPVFSYAAYRISLRFFGNPASEKSGSDSEV